jgi:prepilin-type N-terminal cleavage/methylation domain-containing protein
MSVPSQETTSLRKQFLLGTSTKGFTLLELLIVLAIISALAAITIPIYHNYVDKAKRSVAFATLDTIRKTLEAYHLENGEYPPPPIDFTTGMDSAVPPRNVFLPSLVEQINTDLGIVSYVRGLDDYTLIVTARDRIQTTITITSHETTY